MSKRRKLTDDEIANARKYANETWPDEAVSVRPETNDAGNVEFNRAKITVSVMPDGWTPADLNKGN